MAKKVSIIGSGFSSLASSCYLAQAGYDVTIYEKNAELGGRARQYKSNGYVFDMGPSWYWMPDVFERFFNDFGKSIEDFYELTRISPSYRVYFGEHDFMDVPSELKELEDLFESHEKGAGQKLKGFVKQAKTNYEIAMKELVYKPGQSPLELVNAQTLSRLGSMFRNLSGDVRKLFKNPRLIEVLEFPVLFLGAKPSKTPSFYNFMNWADLGLGTWHPQGGMHQVVEALVSLAKQLGVKFETKAEITEIATENSRASGLRVNGQFIASDVVLSGADYHHTEQLLKPEYRQYSEKYWSKRTFAPSSLLFYVGFDKKISGVKHHSLFFDTDFDRHAEAIYDRPEWPKEPLFYASFPSKTDSSMAPEGMDSATFLIPLATNIEDTEEIREQYWNKILARLEKLTGQELSKHIIHKRSYCLKDFKDDFHSYGGNAYGLANTLRQTAFMRPRIKSKTLKGLFFTGQLTVPGPGVPPALISGKIAAEQIIKHT